MKCKFSLKGIDWSLKEEQAIKLKSEESAPGVMKGWKVVQCEIHFEEGKPGGYFLVRSVAVCHIRLIRG